MPDTHRRRRRRRDATKQFRRVGGVYWTLLTLRSIAHGNFLGYFVNICVSDAL